MNRIIVLMIGILLAVVIWFNLDKPQQAMQTASYAGLKEKVCPLPVSNGYSRVFSNGYVEFQQSVDPHNLYQENINNC